MTHPAARRAMAGSVRCLLRGTLTGIVLVAIAACGTGEQNASGEDTPTSPSSAATTQTTPAPAPTWASPSSSPAQPSRVAPESTAPPATVPASPVQERPAWLGTRVLPERPDGLGEVRPTPPELVDRRLPPPDPRPVTDVFNATVGPVPDQVLARSTWVADCPVRSEDLRYVAMTFWGFDHRAHLGEMIVHRSVAADIVEVFRRLYEARFPVEEMRVVAAHELDAPPTGDGNNTSAFVCRPATGGRSWSQHAYGLAVDVNPFHNPYHRGDVVIPELASAYLDRTRGLPGMIEPGDVVTSAFGGIGWGWGGNWNSSKDWMHFSQSGS